MDYFVNYEPGTCWVYQDTTHANRYDTIELISKRPWCITPDGDIPNNDGYALYYKPSKTKDFTVYVRPWKNNSCGVNVYPGQFYGGGGDQELEVSYSNNQWTTGDYNDSILVGKKMYYNALNIKEYSVNFLNFIFVKKVGLVSFWSQGLPGVPGGVYTLVRIFKK